MQKGKLTQDIVNVVLEMQCTLGYAGETVLIHTVLPTGYEVSTEKNPSATFYVYADQVELN